MAYPLPTEHERRALFCWLEQASSLAAWQRLHSYHQRFVEIVRSVYEEEQRTAGMKQTIHPNELSDLLRRQEAVEAALGRLKGGDRGCFSGLRSPGHFREGLSALWWWQDMYVGSMFGRNGFDASGSPRWRELQTAMGECVLALSDIGVVLRRQDVPAPIEEVGGYASQRGESLIKWWLERKGLPPVPIADPEVLVPTGQVVPHSGIWEPVRAPATLLERMAAGLSSSRPLDGCMNYLHADTPAPTIGFEDDDPPEEGRPTTWRLLWRDERYGDNAVHSHERNYVFVAPVKGEDPFAYP